MAMENSKIIFPLIPQFIIDSQFLCLSTSSFPSRSQPAPATTPASASTLTRFSRRRTRLESKTCLDNAPTKTEKFGKRLENIGNIAVAKLWIEERIGKINRRLKWSIYRTRVFLLHNWMISVLKHLSKRPPRSLFLSFQSLHIWHQ